MKQHVFLGETTVILQEVPPFRGGKQWSLATLVNKQVAQESSTIEMPAALHHNRAKPSKRLIGMDHLTFGVSSKLEEGDYRGAVRLACSEDVVADQSIGTFLKHPPSPPNSDTPALKAASSLVFTIDTQVIMKTISSFPKGLLPQHLKDLTSPSAGDGGASLSTGLVGLTTLILEGRTPPSICLLFFGAKLTALPKKGDGIRPIALGCNLRQPASKCACLHAIGTIPHFSCISKHS